MRSTTCCAADGARTGAGRQAPSVGEIARHVGPVGLLDRTLHSPGLGGEIDNPRWKSLWEGKQLFNEAGEVALTVLKGAVNNATPQPEYKVDGLSGATLTSRGVGNMIEFWFGPNGYGPFLANLKNGEA